MLRKKQARTPLGALLAAMAYPDGQVWPLRHQQWPTIARAKRLGLVDADQYLTETGRALIAAHYAAKL